MTRNSAGYLFRFHPPLALLRLRAKRARRSEQQQETDGQT
jgi:hypothetical protein